MNRFVKDYIFLVGVAGAIIALDQWTKWLVRENIPFGGQWLPESLSWISPYARIMNWHNSGAAFGMFQQGGLVFTVLAFVVIAIILYYFPQTESNDWSLRLALGLQLGGAAGNLIDRLMFGRVTDFISVGSFPIFNVADSSITLGVGVLFLGAWLAKRNEKLEATDESKADDEQQEADSGEVKSGNR